jgi:hypothetical protein
MSFYGNWRVLIDPAINSDWEKTSIATVHGFVDDRNYLGGIFGEFLSTANI